MKANAKKAWFYGWWFAKFSTMMVVCLIISVPFRFNKKYKELWVIAERPDEARDNGYWLYEWITKNHPEVNLRFILSRTSPDYNKMPRQDLIIEPNSISHYISYILSKYAISTHMHGVSPGKAFCLPFLPLMRKKKTVFLQHGVITNILPLRDRMDMIVASSQNEVALIKQASPKLSDSIHITGLARFDQLSDTQAAEKEKIILIMPTFRKWLRDISRLRDAESAFQQTEYYHKWSSLLANEQLSSTLKRHNMRVVFYPHHELQNLAKTFTVSDSRIIIGTQQQYDVQDLLKRASLLVTDYSSILFDFAYMEKPIIYYQFDKGKFFGKHYKSSGEPYPFGDILYNESDVLNELTQTIERGNAIKEKYARDVSGFFEHHDSNNCQRNFNTIKDLTW